MRREGFLLVWAAAALAIVMTLGAGVFLSVSVAARREAERGCDKIHPNKKGSAPDHLVRGRAFRVIIFLQ